MHTNRIKHRVRLDPFLLAGGVGGCNNKNIETSGAIFSVHPRVWSPMKLVLDGSVWKVIKLV